MTMLPGAEERTGASAVVLAVDRNFYAFGLRWTSAASRGTLASEARAAALAEGANYVALHHSFNQFGLAIIRDVPPGIRGAAYRPLVGAAAIADAAGAATLAAFPLDDGRWLVLAIDRKGFLPDGDLIVDNAEQARAHIDLLIAQSPTSWRRKFLPENWNIPDSKTASPQDLLGRSRAPRLVSLWLLTHRRRILLGFAALVAAVIVALVLTVRLVTVRVPVAGVPFQPPKPIAAVWTPAALSIDRCLSAFRDAQLYRAIPGWTASKYTCQGGEGVTVSFARVGDGQISAMRALVPKAQLSDDGRSAVLALPLPALPRISATAAFAQRQRYQVIGLDLAQRLGGAFALQASRKLLPGESTGVSSPNQAWNVVTWTYQTQAPAIVWAGAIARLGSISIDTLTYSPADDLWQLTGSLYASN
jgi:hypothetical protein